MNSVKVQVSKSVTGANYRNDIDMSGMVNIPDLMARKGELNKTVPDCPASAGEAENATPDSSDRE